MENAQKRTLDLVDELFPTPCTADAAPVVRPEPRPEAVVLLAPKSGYVQTVEVEDLAELATATGYCVQLATFVGDYVTAGGILGSCWSKNAAAAPKPDVLQRILRHVHIGFERTLQQDIRVRTAPDW